MKLDIEKREINEKNAKWEWENLHSEYNPEHYYESTGSFVGVFCRNCNSYNPKGSEICEICGIHFIERSCKKCNLFFPKYYGYCAFCGISLAGSQNLRKKPNLERIKAQLDKYFIQHHLANNEKLKKDIDEQYTRLINMNNIYGSEYSWQSIFEKIKQELESLQQQIERQNNELFTIIRKPINTIKNDQIDSKDSDSIWEILRVNKNLHKLFDEKKIQELSIALKIPIFEPVNYEDKVIIIRSIIELEGNTRQLVKQKENNELNQRNQVIRKMIPEEFLKRFFPPEVQIKKCPKCGWVLPQGSNQCPRCKYLIPQ